MVNKPNVGVMLDTFHLNIEEVDMAQAILDCKGCLYHLHVGDSNRAAPGMGHMDFRPIMKALAEIGYQGYVTMELVLHDMTSFFEEYPAVSLKTLKAIEAAL